MDDDIKKLQEMAGIAEGWGNSNKMLAHFYKRLIMIHNEYEKIGERPEVYFDIMNDLEELIQEMGNASVDIK